MLDSDRLSEQDIVRIICTNCELKCIHGNCSALVIVRACIQVNKTMVEDEVIAQYG